MRADTQSFDFKSAANGKTFDSRGSKPNKRPYTVRDLDTALKLPPPGTMRWGVRSKAAVVAAVHGGVLTLEEACKRYALSTAEYLSWESGYADFGLEGLGLAGRQLRRRNLTHSEK